MEYWVEVNLFPVNDSIPEEAEATEAVKCLRMKLSGGPLGMRAEHLCQWLREST